MDTLARMRQLVGSTMDWAANDLVLGLGEVGIEVAAADDRRFKIGDGVRPFSALPYSTVTQAQLDVVTANLVTETSARIAGDQANTTSIAAAQDLARSELLTPPAVSELATMWSAALTGEPKERAGIPAANLALTGPEGVVIRVTGASLRAPRAAYRLLPGHKYEIVAFVRRETEPADPAGDSVHFRAQWLDASKSTNGTTLLESVTLSTGMGLKSFRTIVALAAGDEVVFVAPAATVYLTPYIQTFGSDGVTNIVPTLRVTDLTSNTLISADITGLTGRVTALESINSGTRLAALESITASPNTAWFETTTAATAATIGVTVNQVIVLGKGKDPDLMIQYGRVASGQDFTSADGAKWGIDHSTLGVIAKNVTYEIAPTGGDFTEPGLFTDWLRCRRIKPGVTVTAHLAPTRITCTRRIRGHVDGDNLVWLTDGINGSPWVGTDFDFLNTYWTATNNVTGLPPASWDAARVAFDPVVRAKYKTILEFAGTGDAGRCAMAACNWHTGSWAAAPCLFINSTGSGTTLGTCQIGCETGDGTNNNNADGPGGICLVDNVAFVGFTSTTHQTRYGGTIQWHQGLSAFSGFGNLQTHFAGVVYGTNAFCIGGKSYGLRTNHGGQFYADTVYTRGNASALTAYNSGMVWAQNCDTQYNYVGVSVSWNSSTKVNSGKVKNNSRQNMSITSGGTIDAGNVDMVSTVSYPGTPTGTCLYGIYIFGGGSIDIASGTNTGSQTDINVIAAGVVTAQGATVGPVTITNSGIGGVTEGGVLTRDALIGHYTVPPQGFVKRPRYAQVEVTGAVVFVPNPCPKSIGLIQPAGSVGTAIAITSFDLTAFQAGLKPGERLAIVAPNAATGETVTITDGSTLSLRAASRYLSANTDVLELLRPTDSAPNVLIEVGTSRNANNSSSDVKRVRNFLGPGGTPATRDDDVICCNKAETAAIAIAMDTNMNFLGSELIVKDSRGVAATYNITITPGGGKTIDGSASYVINANRGFVRIAYDGTNFQVIGKG